MPSPSLLGRLGALEPGFSLAPGSSSLLPPPNPLQPPSPLPCPSLSLPPVTVACLLVVTLLSQGTRTIKGRQLGTHAAASDHPLQGTAPQAPPWSSGGRATSSAAWASERASTAGKAAPTPEQGCGTRAHSTSGAGVLPEWRAEGWPVAARAAKACPAGLSPSRTDAALVWPAVRATAAATLLSLVRAALPPLATHRRAAAPLPDSHCMAGIPFHRLSWWRRCWRRLQ